MSEGSVLIEKRKSCAQEKIFMLTGLDQSDIDAIIELDPIGLLGKGGYGGVFKKSYEGKEYAVKSQPFDKNITHEIFDRELQIGLILSADEETRRYIPFTFGGKRTETHGYIVMEPIDGFTIDEIFEKRYTTQDEINFMKEKLVEGLNAIHRKHIVHLDIGNTKNILITLDNDEIHDVVIIDFNGGRFTDIAMPWDKELNDLHTPYHPTTNLKEASNIFKSKPATNVKNIRKIHSEARKIREFERLPQLGPDQIADLARCEEELLYLENQYRNYLANTYTDREADWNTKAEARNKIRIGGIMKILKTNINIITDNNALFLEAFLNEIGEVYKSVFFAARKAKILYKPSYEMGIEQALRLTKELYRQLQERVATGMDEGTAIREIQEVVPRLVEEQLRDLVLDGPKLFLGGKRKRKTKKNKCKLKSKKTRRNY